MPHFNPPGPPRKETIAKVKTEVIQHGHKDVSKSQTLPQVKAKDTTPEPKPYAEILTMTSTEPVVLFKKRNYKVRLTVGINSTVAHPVTSVLDTGAGPNLINKDFLPTQWHSNIRPMKDPGLVGATKQAVVMQGVILLHVCLGELRVRVWFGIVERLAFKV